MKMENILPKERVLWWRQTLLFVVFFFISTLAAMAQSMSDEQVAKYLQQAMKTGASQGKVLGDLMKRGVTVEQLKRVRRKYEKESKQGNLGKIKELEEKGDDRSRKNNGEEKEGTAQQLNSLNPFSEEDFNESSEAYEEMRNAIQPFYPDSIEDTKIGNKLRVFGRDIFNNKKLTFEPNMNIATPTNYRLGPGDAVFIDIYGASQKTLPSSVSPDGFITIEGFGPIQVSGLTVAQANAKIKSQMGGRYASSQIKLTVGQTRTIMVQVMGSAKAPGTYRLSAFATVFHALYMAGGVDDIGTLRNIKVYRNGRLVSTVDIYDYMLNGRLTGNVRLADNDVIMIEPYECIVAITGKVKRPMYYEMKRSESVGTIVKYAGGFTGDAYQKSVRLIRKTGKEYSIHTVGEFEMNAMQLADADSISVDSVLNRYSNRVEIKGAVFRPGDYEVGGSIHSVRDLVTAAEGLKEEAFTAHAVLHRMREDRTLEVVALDLEGIMRGTIADIPLKKDDALFVPTKQEMMQDRTLTVHGEVQFPGVYKYANNTTLESLILQAGGLKDAASVIKVDVARRISNPKATNTDSVLARTFSFSLKDGFVLSGEAGFKLQPFDEVYVRRSPGYSEQKNVVVEGNVMFAGTYTLSKKNERLSDIIKAAGGVTKYAYVRGARLERRASQEEKMRYQDLLKQQSIQTTSKDTLDLKKIEMGDTYYVGINLEKALQAPGTDADLVLREGDKIIVPEYNGTVRVSGEVMMPTTMAYTQGRKAKWYIKRAGGFSSRAKKSKTFVMYMNGEVAELTANTTVRPGCEIVVPTKPNIEGLTIVQWLSIATSISTIATMFVTIANVLKK